MLQKLLYIASHKFLEKKFLIYSPYDRALDYVHAIHPILDSTSLVGQILEHFDTLRLFLFHFWVKIHAMVGLSNLTVTGKPFIILKISIKSFF